MKVPLTSTKVLIPHWRAFAQLGTDFDYYTKDFFKQVELDYPVSLGDYKRSQTPDDPMVLHMCYVHHDGVTKGPEQWREGRRRLRRRTRHQGDHGQSVAAWIRLLASPALGADVCRAGAIGLDEGIAIAQRAIAQRAIAQRAIDDRDPFFVMSARSYPTYAKLRTDPRFGEVVRRLRFHRLGGSGVNLVFRPGPARGV